MRWEVRVRYQDSKQNKQEVVAEVDYAVTGLDAMKAAIEAVQEEEDGKAKILRCDPLPLSSLLVKQGSFPHDRRRQG